MLPLSPYLYLKINKNKHWISCVYCMIILAASGHWSDGKHCRLPVFHSNCNFLPTSNISPFHWLSTLRVLGMVINDNQKCIKPCLCLLVRVYISTLPNSSIFQVDCFAAFETNPTLHEPLNEITPSLFPLSWSNS